MGAGYTKVLNHLDVGPEEKDDKLKKKYLKILTNGKIPKNPALTWKSITLDAKNAEKTADNLKEGALFIHSARAKDQYILVCISQSDPDSVTFATAYVMLLSGLSPDYAERVIVNLLKESDLKLEGKYKKSLEILHKQASPKVLREQLFQPTGEYSLSLLTEDVNRIYELAGLPKPTLLQVKLENDATITPTAPNHSDQTREITVPKKTPDSPSKPEGVKNDPPKEHTPMTLEETENRIPAYPGSHSDKPARSGYSELAEAHSVHVEASLLTKALPKSFNANDYDSKLVFSEHSMTDCDKYVPSITQWNSVQSTQPTPAAGTQSQKHVVFNEPEKKNKSEPNHVEPITLTNAKSQKSAVPTEPQKNSEPSLVEPVIVTSAKSQKSAAPSTPEAVAPALASLVPKATSESAKPPVSEHTISILSELKGSNDSQNKQATGNHEIHGNGTNAASAEPVKRKVNIKIVRLKPANIEHHIKMVEEHLSNGTTEDQTKRKHIQIIKRTPKVNAK